MKAVLFPWIFLLIYMTTPTNTLQAETKISYHISFTEPQAHYVEVEMKIHGLSRQFVDVKMPVWAPGSYLVREFSKNVENFSASGSTKKGLSYKKINKNTWRVKSDNDKEITLNYRIYAFEISVRTSFVDASHAFLSPTGIFMYVDGLINSPATVTIQPVNSWSKISTGLEMVKGKQNTFLASDFDILYDSPIEIGNQDVFEFTAAGVKHEVAMYGGGNYDKAKLSRDMAAIVEEESKIFGENPNKKYVFIIHNFQAGGGGLEHLNSTVLGAKRTGYTDAETYKEFLGLVAHEYFHLWNVKRLRPKALGPFDYNNENYTSELWIAEGFTAYYDNLILRRTGIYSPERYLQILCNDIGTVENQPGNKIQPLSEASFDAWIKYYRPNENSRNSTVSYYSKGALVAMILDLEIIKTSRGEKNLDDLMKAMYNEYYKKQKRGYTLAEFKALAEKTAGEPLDEIFSSYVDGTHPIDYNRYTGAAGVYLSNEASNSAFLGVGTQLRDGKLIITSVTRASGAWIAGLNVNDEIIAVDGFRVNSPTDLSEFDKGVSPKRAGDKIAVLISRDGILQTIEAKLGTNPNQRYRLEIDPEASAAQIALRKKWLFIN